MPQVFANVARAQLSVAAAPADTSLTIGSGGALFPVADTGTLAVTEGTTTTNWFKLVINDAAGNYEIVYVRSHTAAANSFTNVLRAQEGTTAQTWAIGSTVGIRPTAADAADWESKLPTTTPVPVGLREVRVAMPGSEINLNQGNYFTRTNSGAVTLSVSQVPAAGTAASFILDLTNGGTGTVTWWTGMKWAGGTAPTLTAAGRDVLGFFTHDGGTTWTGLLLGKDVK